MTALTSRSNSRSRAVGPHPPSHPAEGGFTLAEAMIVLALFSMLLIGGFNSLFLGHKSSRHQAENSTALEIVQGQLESLRGQEYDYPSAVFSNISYSTSNTVTVTLDSSGNTNLLTAPLVTTVAPFNYGTNVVGHIVTATITLTTSKQPRIVQLQTLVNKFTSTQ